MSSNLLLLGRREIVLATLGGGALCACGRSEPKTPLAHLYGREWVHAAYKLHGDEYAELELGATKSARSSYAVLARRGVVSLDALQTRGVPFHVRASQTGETFQVERDVPERLTFTANMSESDRERAQKQWERAREHIQHDYEEIRHLNDALTRLLLQIRRIRSAVERGKVEQFNMTRQLIAMKDGTLPFELPYQVSAQDYERILLMLLDRIQDDNARLAKVESAIVAVGLTARATDANSGSLSANLYRVLLAVERDADASEIPPTTYPGDGDRRQKAIQRGKALFAKIQASEEFKKWDKQKDTESLEKIGGLLAVLDQVTHLGASQVFKQVLSIYRGDGDYLSYLKTAVAVLPLGGELSSTLNTAIDTTEKVRAVAGQIKQLKGHAAQIAALKDQGDSGALLNMATSYGRARLDRQLAFYKDKADVENVAEELAATPLASRAQLAVDKLKGLSEAPVD